MNQHLTPATIETQWDAAKQLLINYRESGIKATTAYIELGERLLEIKEELAKDKCSTLIPGAFQNSSIGQAVPSRISTTYETKHPFQEGNGWQAECNARLGISYKTADRYIADYQAYKNLVELCEEDPVFTELLDVVKRGELKATEALEYIESSAVPIHDVGDGEEPASPEVNQHIAQNWAGIEQHLKGGKWGPDYRRYLEMQAAALDQGDELAAHNLIEVAGGNVTIARAYAGWKGGAATAAKARKDADYGKLLPKVGTTLKHGWAKFYDLAPQKQQQFSDTWADAISEMPEPIMILTFRILQERLGMPKRG
jgi:hypothetical protein